MIRLVAATVGVFGLFGLIAGPVGAEVTAEQVQGAIDRGTGYLLAQQRDDGSWRGPGGVSALCTLALLSAGVKLDQEEMQMQKALYHLRYSIPPKRTYAVSVQTMVFARAEPDRDRELIVRNVRWLEETQIAEGPKKGAWCYPYVVGGGSDVHEKDGVPIIGDNSNSQFALLALHEAERVGVAANERTWEMAKEYWEQCQNADGSWGYPDRDGGTGSMTCAGISSLVIAADRVQQSDARESGETERVERAIRWLGRFYSVTSNPRSGRWNLYYLYGLERAGRLTSRRFIPLPSRRGQPSRADWYRDGADHLVRTQDSETGSWTSSPVETNHVIGTSFALLFLSKGRRPTPPTAN